MIRTLVLAVSVLLVSTSAAEAAGVIVFASGRDGARFDALYTVDSSGASLRELRSGLNADSWTRNGRRLVVVESTPAGDELVVTDADGAQRRIAAGVDVYNYAWSPSGDAIAFDTLPADASHIFVLDVASASKTDLGAGRFPRWSSDGRQLAVLRRGRATQGFDLWIVRRDGSAARNVTGAIDPGEFRWSPSGSYLAYLQFDRLWAVRAKGGNPQMISVWTNNIGRVSWSHDGKLLAFERLVRTSDGVRGRVQIAKPDGQGVHSVLMQANDVLPVWSPRRNQLAVTLQSTRDDRLFLVNASGRGRRVLMTDPVVQAPVWSADGNTVAVAAGDPLDVWAIDTRARDRQRVTQGAKYGYSNRPVRWLPATAPEAVLPGRPVGPEIAVDSVVEGRLVKSRRPIHQLAADGAMVAIHYDRAIDYDPSIDYRCFDIWDTARGEITRLPMGACGGIIGCCSLGAGGFVDLALAGDRLAWSGFTHFAGLDIFDLFSLSTTQPLPQLLANVCPDNRYGDCLIPEADLEGDGSLIAFDTWQPSCSFPSYPRPCAISPKRNGHLWRVAGDRAALVASSQGALTALSVDSGRILVDRQNGTLELMRQDGSSLGKVEAATFREAKVQGADVVVLGNAGLAEYDASTFGLRHLWPLGCGDPAQADVHDGVVIYVCGQYVHVVHLATGSDVALFPLGSNPQVQLEAPGLYYGYKVPDAQYPGRVTFIPFADLP